jgi:nitronate monooxygenase/enoyl-[acyl-carrier protein] reductase II
MPPFNRPGGPAEPRALRTALIDRLRDAPETVDPEQAGRELRAALLEGRGEDHLPFTGQSAALIGDVLPARDIVRRVVSEAKAVLAALPRP